MKIELRNGVVNISGYVNAVGRDSKPITKPDGSQFVEMIEPGVFKEALTRAKNVDVLLNHNEQRKLGSTSNGNLKLKEDNIGLFAEFSTSDGDVVNMAQNGELRGWSFGMFVNKDEMEQRSEKIPRRHVQNMDIFEVSIINNKMTPCYAGTSLECRSDSEESVVKETRTMDDEIDFTDFGEEKRAQWQEKVDAIRARDSISAWEERLAELRFNPYHDPVNGRFTTSDGGGMGGVLYSKGGKSAYVFDRDIDSEYSKWKAEKTVEKQTALANDIYHKKYKSAEEYHQALSEKYNGITSVDKIKTAKDVADFINYDTQKGYYGTTQLLGGQKGMASTWKRVGASELSIENPGFSSGTTAITIPKNQEHVFSGSVSKLKSAGIDIGHWLDDKYLVTKKKGARVNKWLEGL